MARSKAKKIRLEMSRQTLALVAFAAMVALVWMFVFGVFIGRRYSPDTYVARPPSAKSLQTKAPTKDQPAERFAADLARHKREALAHKPGQAPEPKRGPDTGRQTPVRRAYAFQVGAFSEEERAQALMAELARAGYPTYLFTGETSPRYRVRVGPYGERQEAEEAAAIVGKRLGIKPYLLNVDGSQGPAG